MVISFLSRLLVTAGCGEFRAFSTRVVGEDARQLVRGRHFQLVVAAVLGALVESPANEVRGVPKARALHVVVTHLADALGPQRLPAQILAGVPPARAARHALSFAHRLGPIAPR